MRHASLLVVLGSMSLFLPACDGDDGGSGAATGGTSSGGGSTGGSSSGGSSSDGGGTGTGNAPGSGDAEFTDLPGKIRFANFISDGMAGVNVDLYWGTDFDQSESIGTLAYGEVTEFLVPRRIDSFVLDADEARYFVVPEGDTTSTIPQFLSQDDPAFADETQFTVAFAAVENFTTDDLRISSTVFQEHELVAPPEGMAHVFVWSNAFDQIEGGDFVVVGADGICDPERGDGAGANIGTPALIPDGATGLALFDANTEPPCDTSATPADGAVAAGHSYVLIGEAETYEIDARHTVLLEVGATN
jgi:hypothetical protein